MSKVLPTIRFAGIGSRETPVKILKCMSTCAKSFTAQQVVLRSGGANGADIAFESGAGRGLKEIFVADDATPESIELASKYHPNWPACSPYAKQLMGRNAMIILGSDLKTPVDFVVCWTPGGKVTGETGHGLRIAEAYQIPIFNVAKKSAVEDLRSLHAYITMSGEMPEKTRPKQDSVLSDAEAADIISEVMKAPKDK